MLLRDNRGALRTVTKVIPAVEKREVFNGEKRCFLERCASTVVKPNAVLFIFCNGMNRPMGMPQSKLLIGKLMTEIVENVNMRMRVMFLAMCDYLKWNAENLQKPFLDSEPLFVEVIPDEKTEVNLSDESEGGIGGMAIGIVDEFIEDETATEGEIKERGEDSAEEEVCEDEESA